MQVVVQVPGAGTKGGRTQGIECIQDSRVRIWVDATRFVSGSWEFDEDSQDLPVFVKLSEARRNLKETERRKSFGDVE